MILGCHDGCVPSYLAAASWIHISYFMRLRSNLKSTPKKNKPFRSLPSPCHRSVSLFYLSRNSVPKAATQHAQSIQHNLCHWRESFLSLVGVWPQTRSWELWPFWKCWPVAAALSYPAYSPMRAKYSLICLVSQKDWAGNSALSFSFFSGSPWQRMGVFCLLPSSWVAGRKGSESPLLLGPALKS